MGRDRERHTLHPLSPPGPPGGQRFRRHVGSSARRLVKVDDFFSALCLGPLGWHLCAHEWLEGGAVPASGGVVLSGVFVASGGLFRVCMESVSVAGGIVSPQKR